jgi:virulence-associated protein VapD
LPCEDHRFRDLQRTAYVTELRVREKEHGDKTEKCFFFIPGLGTICIRNIIKTMQKKDKKLKVIYKPVEQIDEFKLDSAFDFIFRKAIEFNKKKTLNNIE